MEIETLTKWLVGVFLGVLLLFGVVKTVDTNETCAIVTLGNVDGVAHTGVNLRIPFITGYSCYSRQPLVYQTVEEAQGDADFLDFPVEIKTSDGQTAYVDFNLSFHIKPENAIFVRSSVADNMQGVVTRVVANFGRSIPRDLAPEYSATLLYGTGRVAYGTEIEEQLVPLFAKYGVTLDEFELRDITFDPAYETAIEQQQIASENIETARFQAEQAVFDAQKIAELAKGEAQAEIERAKGEAQAIALRGAALRDNPEVLKLNFIEALKTANWMLVPWNDVQPFLPLDLPQ